MNKFYEEEIDDEEMDYEITEHDFLDYLLDNELLAPTYTWLNYYEVPLYVIKDAVTEHYNNYKDFCKANGLNIEIIL